MNMYHQNAVTPADINEHLPFLFRLAGTCSHITEMGTGSMRSTAAFLASKPAVFRSYDLKKPARLAEMEALGRAAGVDVRLITADVRQIEIEPTELLFIDTWHVESQVEIELRLHADKASRYLVFHDTEIFGERGESLGHRGIWYGIQKYMREHSEWKLIHHAPYNHGLTTFARV